MPSIRRRLLWRTGFVLPFVLLALAVVAPLAVRADPGTAWVGSGSSTPGTGTNTVVHDGTGVDPAQFSYDFNDCSVPVTCGGGGISGSWDFHTTAATSGTVRLDWTYTGFHAFFMVRVGLDAYVGTEGGPATVVLVNDGPAVCCTPPSGGFTYSGTTFLDVQASDVYGFAMTGSNSDSNSTLQGTLTVNVAYAEAPQDPTHQTVNSIDDHDDGTCGTVDCTLREAINAANAHLSASPDLIDFDLGPGLQTIELTAALPTIDDPVVIDGGAGPAGPGCATGLTVAVEGSAIPGSGTSGLEFLDDATGSTVRGLSVHDFSGVGILANGASDMAIECNEITANGADGVRVFDPSLGVRVEANSIHDNAGLGINLDADGVTPNDTLDADESANHLQNFPVLIRAVPGTPGLIAGRINSSANTTFELLFYASSACDPTGNGEGANLLNGTIVTTDASGDASFALATDVPDSTVVTATATAPDGSTSEFSPCAAVSVDNDSWPRALDISATGNATGIIDSPGQTRWYKFTVTPGEQVTVNLSNLPAPYNLALFKDISQAYTTLATPADLNKLSAEFSPQAFSPQAFSPQAFSPQAFSPQAFSPQAFSPQAFSPQVFSPQAFSPQAFSPQAFSPQAFSPQAFSPQAFSPQAFSPQAFSPQAFSPQAFSPQAFSSAQTRSLISVSAASGNAPESITANTWNNTGFFYVRVSGQGDAFDVNDAFSVQVTQTGADCQGIVDIGAAPPDATETGIKTVILVDSSRLADSGPGSTLATRLAAFAARPEVAGAIVDVASPVNQRIADLNAQADSHTSCPYAKNLVAGALKDIVDSYRPANPGLAYVVIVGGDNVIPFFRYADESLLGPESGYIPPVRDTSASDASLRLNYVLSQDAYGARTTIAQGVNDFPVPDLAVGRLVETAQEATGMLDAYLSTAAGVVPQPASSLVTGYDFLADAADAVQADLSAGTGNPGDTLIAPNNISPQDPLSWTASDLRATFLGSRHDLIFLAGHFNANSALAADFATSVLTSELAASAVNLTNAIVFSAGCHSGYNVVDGDVIPGVPVGLDWPEAFAQKGATLIAGTGYQYGDTDFLEYSERIYSGFSHELRVGTGAVSVGQALVNSKQAYLRATPDIRGIHKKALLEATLFGLPMLSVDFGHGRITPPADTSIVSGTTGFSGSGPGATLGLQFANVHIAETLTRHDVTLTGIGSPDVTATYYSGPDGVTTNPAEPAVPLISKNVDVPGYTLRGVGFRGGTYADENVIPLTGAATTELRGVHVPFGSPVFYPMRLSTPNYFDALGSGDTRLLITPAQHRSNGLGQDFSTLRLYDGLDLRLFYSNNIEHAQVSGETITPALAAAPTIVNTAATTDAGMINFDARVVGDPAAGIQGVWITYTGFDQAWHSFDLVQDAADSTHWTGTLDPLGHDPADLRFIIQAVNGVGLVTLDDSFGQYFRAAAAEAAQPNPTATTLDAGATSGAYGSTITVGATLSGASPLSGQTIVFTLGTATNIGTTDAGGHASADFQLASIPAPYSLSATFLGDTADAGSFDSRSFTIDKVGTTLAITPPPGGVGVGADPGITTTLEDTNTPPVPLGGRSIYFVVTGASGLTRPVIADQQGRASLGAVSLPPGDYTVTAYFNGTIPITGQSPITLTDSTYLESSASTSLTILTSAPTFAFNLATLPAKTLGDAPFSVAPFVTTNSPGVVSFATGLGSVGCTVDPAGLVTLTGAATGAQSCVIDASQAAGGIYGAAGPIAQSFNIAKGTPNLALAVLPDRNFGTGPFDIHAAASSNSTGTISFALGTGSVGCAINASGTTLTLTGLAQGSSFCVIKASQDADANYNAAGPVSRQFHINTGTQTITFTSIAPATAVYGDSYTPTATGGGSGKPVTFSGSGACAFSSGKVTMTIAGTCTVTANQAGNSLYNAAPPATQVFAVGKKGASLAYTGSLSWSTGSGSSVNVTFNGQVTKPAGGSSVITKATVDFLIFSSTNPGPTPTYTCSASVNSSGVASCSRALGLDSWTVVMTIPGTNAFFTAPAAEPVVLTVTQATSAKYTTGAGWIIDPSFNDIPVKVSPTRNHGIFGFAVRARSGTTPQGLAIYEFRGVDGYDYIFTITSWTGGSLTFGTGTASFNGRCSVIVVNPVNFHPVPGLGGSNFTCRFDVRDGSPDKFAMSAFTSAGVLYHQAGTAASPIALGNGSIVVKQ